MRKRIGPALAAAVVMTLSPALRAAEQENSTPPARVYGPAPKPPPRTYGPQPAPGAKPSVTVKVAGRTESRKAGSAGEALTPAHGGEHADTAKADGKRRSVTIYFMHADEKQSIVEFTLPETEVKTGMTFEAKNTEADVHDGKLLLRGDVRMRFANGLRLQAQLVSVTVNRDEGAVEVVVKE
jgi:hypothetical protein